MKKAGLFDPLPIKGITLPNRLVMAPMALDHGTVRGEVTTKVIDHYTPRAEAERQSEPKSAKEKGRAGIGLVLVEHTYVNANGKAHPHQLGLERDSQIAGLRDLTDRLHQEGVPVGIQISHGGARAMEQPSAPSAVYTACLSRFGHSPAEAEVPRQLGLNEIRHLTEDFAQAARRGQKAGFDLIEIHGAHGYLLNQFYSPLTNRRTDRYGGSLGNRLRFPLEVVGAVREAVGPDLPIFYRLGADDRLPGGTTLEDSIKAVPRLIAAGVDGLDISGGLCGYLKEGGEGFFSYMSERLKPFSSVPVMTTGGIRDAGTAQRLIEEQKADLIGIGRSLLADPAWARKAWRAVSPCESQNGI